MSMAKRTTSVAVEVYDRGASGPATKYRESAMITIEGRSRGSIAVERIEVRSYSDATLFDRLHARSQLSDRQHQAASRLGQLWTSAGLNARITATLGASGSGDGFDDADWTEPLDVGPDAPGPRDRYRAVMRTLTVPHCLRLEQMLCGEHAGIFGLGELQDALESLANDWGME